MHEPELMKLIFAVFPVSQTMGLTSQFFLNLIVYNTATDRGVF